jgi:hypothetical protein
MVVNLVLPPSKEPSLSDPFFAWMGRLVEVGGGLGNSCLSFVFGGGGGILALLTACGGATLGNLTEPSFGMKPLPMSQSTARFDA